MGKYIQHVIHISLVLLLAFAQTDYIDKSYYLSHSFYDEMMINDLDT